MKIAHELSAESPYRNTRFRVVLIGAGGNGSNVLFGLPYLHHALIAWGNRGGLDVVVIDGDTVSPFNCVRQPFGHADIGLNKATVLVNRVNLFHNLDWKSVPGYFSNSFETKGSIDLVISCVDTRAARWEMHKAFHSKVGGWANTRYWLDIGNNAASGQFVLGQPPNAVNPPSRKRLRTVTELFPSIMDKSLGEGDLPSCSAAEALDRQEPFINNVLASSALAMMTRLLRYGSLDHHGAFYNASTGRSAPLPVDPELWEKQARRRKLAA